MSANSTRVKIIGPGVLRWARVFSLTPAPQETAAMSGGQRKTPMTARDMGEFYLHTLMGR